MFKYYIRREPDVVRLGDFSLVFNTDDKNVQQFQINAIIRHEDYTSNSFHDDIALIKLENSAS